MLFLLNFSRVNGSPASTFAPTMVSDELKMLYFAMGMEFAGAVLQPSQSSLFCFVYPMCSLIYSHAFLDSALYLLCAPA